MRSYECQFLGGFLEYYKWTHQTEYDTYTQTKKQKLVPYTGSDKILECTCILFDLTTI